MKRFTVRCGALTLALSIGLPSPGVASSIAFFVNNAGDHDFGLQTLIPSGFGSGEFTFEFWIRPDNSFPVGPTTNGTPQQLINWSNRDNEPYSSGGWWFEGNFLLDGHNNASFHQGTFSLQFYGGGRLRWLFGDGVAAGAGGHWSVGAYPATQTPSLLDGAWHQVTLVRRWSGASSATLELWIDGRLIATTTSPARTNMRTYWDNWPGFPNGQQGWFWGAEKGVALTTTGQYEDYKGLLDEMRFWSRAKTPAEIASDYARPVTGTEPGLVGHYPFSEGTGTSTCNRLNTQQCMQLFRMKPGYWSSQEAPIGTVPSAPRPPTNLRIVR
jgi:Concanavalin A-like lectin/glucanases superfamily